MRFHWLDKEGNITGVGTLKLGASLKGLHIHIDDRPDYVTIDAKEFENTTLNEKQMIQHFKALKKALYFGGKVYLEISNYG